MTIADYFGASLLTLGEVVGCDFAAYPRVRAWLGRMKQLGSWKRVNATLDAVAAAHAGESFVTV
jgi:glutathione S-transferase